MSIKKELIVEHPSKIEIVMDGVANLHVSVTPMLSDAGKRSDPCVQFPVAWDHPRTVPERLLRDAYRVILEGATLDGEAKELVCACISYVCNEAPRARV